MKEKTLLREFVRYVVLNICGMIGLSCYIFADTFFVSRGLGANGLAALNLAIPIYSFVHGSGLMLGMGGATKYSIYMGQEKPKNANRIYTNTIYDMVVFAVSFVAIGIFFSGNLALMLGADEEIFGAVLATGFAPVISLGVLSKHWITKNNRFHFEKIKSSLKMIGNIISLGIPALITEVASGIVMIVFNALILKMQGNIGVAAYGVIANLSLVATSVYTGIAQGIQPILSRVYGYGDAKSVKQTLKYAVRLMLFISGVIYLCFFMEANPVVGFFNSERNMQLQQIAETGLKLYFTAIVFVGFNIVISTYFTSTEKALPAQIVSLSRGFIFIIPMAFSMSFLFGMTGVWLSYPSTEGMVALAGVILYKKSIGGKRNVQGNAEEKTNFN